MAATDDLTTLVCLFHRQEQAQATVTALLQAGISQSSISLMDKDSSQDRNSGRSSLAELGVPEDDQDHLMEGLRNGGTIVAVSGMSDHEDEDKVEAIFEAHQAEKINEAVIDTDNVGYAAPLAGAAAVGMAGAGTAAVPIVEEELAVRKRTVDQAGVRVYRRVIEIPVEESVELREEHVHVERRPVNRLATEGDFAAQGNQTIELTETAEETVVRKDARVVEEVFIGKEATQRIETIHDTLRKTEVEVEEVVPNRNVSTKRRDF